MIIFYTNSLSNKDEMQKTFDKIISDISSLGHKVISLEFMKYEDLIDLEKAKQRESKISIHNQFIRKAIELADAAIFETSSYSFKLGQEAQMALDKKVPVLCVSNKIDYSNKVQDPYFYSKIYKSDSELKKYISEFIQTVKSKHLNKRVNVFLHNKHINFLDWYVNSNPNTNRSEIIRDALEKIMEENKDFKSRL